jgi:hypothetical protein
LWTVANVAVSEPISASLLCWISCIWLPLIVGLTPKQPLWNSPGLKEPFTPQLCFIGFERCRDISFPIMGRSETQRNDSDQDRQ